MAKDKYTVERDRQEAEKKRLRGEQANDIIIDEDHTIDDGSNDSVVSEGIGFDPIVESEYPGSITGSDNEPESN